MGFFNSKWIVEFEFSKGLLSSNKKGTMVVEATSEYSAKDIAKKVLRGIYSYVKILSAHKSSGRAEEKQVTFKTPQVTIEENPTIPNVNYSSQKSYVSSSYTRQKTKEEIREEEREIERRIKESKIQSKKNEIKRFERKPVLTGIFLSIGSLFMFLLGWIPHWFWNTKAKEDKELLEWYYGVGHKPSEELSIEITESIEHAEKMSSAAICIPFILLALGIGLTVLLVVLSKKKNKVKIEKAQEELKEFEGSAK